VEEAAEFLQRAEIPADERQPVPEDRDSLVASAVSKGFNLYCVVSLQPLVHRKRVGKHDNCHEELGPGFAFQVDVLKAKTVRLEMLEAVLNFPPDRVYIGYRRSWPAQVGHKQDHGLFSLRVRVFHGYQVQRQPI